MTGDSKEQFKPELCQCCGQTTTYRLGLDRGSVEILLEIFAGISRKGVNEIHPARELDFTGEKKWFLTNLSRPRFHGLIAYVKDKKGYYCLTRKAGKFLRGLPIAQYAIISKAEGHNIGYWMPDEYQITMKELLKSDELPYWEGDAMKVLDIIDPPERIIETAGQGVLTFAYH